MANIRKLSGVLVVIAVLLGAALWVSKNSHQGPPDLDFHLSDFHHKTHDFELERKGKGVFVHFWASWCPPCLKELPEFNEFILKNEKNPDYEFWLISVDEKEEAALGILKKYKWPEGVRLLFDPTKTAARKWGTWDYPETYLLRLSDLKRIKWLGTRDWENPRYIKEINDFLLIK
ncbi:MAG: TlpA family protein disulfide reductase [Xanthomonadaceae bacterium]|nr:TlpA family protein disulfide reductase [Xanthomonadaceae bacterium]